MAFYLSTIGVGMLIIIAINLLLKTGTWYYIVIATVSLTALTLLLDGAAALLVHLLPNRWFSADNPHYLVSARAQRRYQRLGVKRWKDKIWELGGLGGFSKRNLNEPLSAAYIERFITECHKGVLTHRLSYLVGFLTMPFLWNACALTVALPIALVNLFLNILPTVVLRSNTPRLRTLLCRLKRKEERQAEKALALQAEK